MSTAYSNVTRLMWNLRLARPTEIPARSAGSLADLAERHGFDVMTQYDPHAHYLRVTGIHRARRIGFCVGWAEGRSPSTLVWTPTTGRYPDTMLMAALRRLVAE